MVQEATEQELKTSASDALFGRSTSDQNLPVTETSPGNGSLHGSDSYSRLSLGRSVSYLTKLESLASSAVRSADKVGAKLIIVYTQTGSHSPAHLPRDTRQRSLKPAQDYQRRVISALQHIRNHSSSRVRSMMH